MDQSSFEPPYGCFLLRKRWHLNKIIWWKTQVSSGQNKWPMWNILFLCWTLTLINISAVRNSIPTQNIWSTKFSIVTRCFFDSSFAQKFEIQPTPKFSQNTGTHTYIYIYIYIYKLKTFIYRYDMIDKYISGSWLFESISQFDQTASWQYSFLQNHQEFAWLQSKQSQFTVGNAAHYTHPPICLCEIMLRCRKRQLDAAFEACHPG